MSVVSNRPGRAEARTDPQHNLLDALACFGGEGVDARLVLLRALRTRNPRRISAELFNAYARILLHLVSSGVVRMEATTVGAPSLAVVNREGEPQREVALGRLPEPPDWGGGPDASDLSWVLALLEAAWTDSIMRECADFASTARRRLGGDRRENPRPRPRPRPS